MNQFKNMILVRGTVNWTGKKKATFKMIPLTNECPYIEGIFDPDSMAFGLIGKFKKSEYEMVPCLDENGDPEKKKKIVKEGEVPFKIERRLLEKWNEYELLTEEEIITFIDMFAINATTFDYKFFFKKAAEDAKANVTNTVLDIKPAPKERVEMKATVTQD